ncbi:MAG: cell division FtsA domain-containing protein [Anaerolineae bacterium]
MSNLLQNAFRKNKEANDKPSFRSVIDLGTEYVKALVVEVEEDRAIIIGQGVARHKGSYASDGAIGDLETVTATCDQALRQAEDMTEEVYGRKVVPDQAVMGIPSPLIRGAAYTVKQQRSSPKRPVSQRELPQLLQRVQRLALQQLSQEFASQELALVDSAIGEIAIDGHQVTDPVGFRGENLAVTVFNALALRESLDGLRNIAEGLELEPPLLVPESRVVASFLKGSEVIGLDVGGRETEIFWTRNGGLLASRTVPLGGRAVSQRLAEGLHLSLQEAEALKLSRSRGQINETTPVPVGEILSGAVVVWLAEVERQLRVLAGGRNLPHSIYLCGGGSELPELVEAVRTFSWMGELLFARCPEVEVLNPEKVPGLLDRTGLSLGRGGVIAMGLARWACAAETMKNEADLPAQLLAKVMRKDFDAFLGGM